MLLDEAQALAEPDIRAVALEFLQLTISLVGVIEEVVAPIVRDLPDAAAAMPDDILKTIILRTVRGSIAEVPLSKHAGGIAVLGKEIRERAFVRVQHRAPGAGAVGTVSPWIPGQ